MYPKKVQHQTGFFLLWNIKLWDSLNGIILINGCAWRSPESVSGTNMTPVWIIGKHVVWTSSKSAHHGSARESNLQAHRSFSDMRWRWETLCLTIQSSSTKAVMESRWHRVAQPQLATQKDMTDRAIVLDPSAHPEHDEALCFLRGRVTSPDDFKKSTNNLSLSLFVFPCTSAAKGKLSSFQTNRKNNPMSWRRRQYEVLTGWSPCWFPALLATECVLMNKAINATGRENKRGRRKRERQRERESTEGYN